MSVRGEAIKKIEYLTDEIDDLVNGYTPSFPSVEGRLDRKLAVARDALWEVQNLFSDQPDPDEEEEDLL